MEKNKKIIFISNNLSSSHDKARIEEYINNGVDVEVYGFTRAADSGIIMQSELYKPIVLGHILPSYPTRLRTYYKAIKKLRAEKDKECYVYYILGLDIAMIFVLLGKNVKYIYEEADLVYTYMPNRMLISLFKRIDAYVQRHAYLAVFTSEGFLHYHYGSSQPSNVIIVPNRLNKSVLSVQRVSDSTEKKELKFGFVGAPRFNAIRNFIKVFCQNFPDREFHVFGGPIPEDFKGLEQFKNCIFHGRFSSPIDLPQIYSKIDLVLCTYDAEYENVRYAEPNKIYESIYFEKPIIVSKNTFLSEKVHKLGIGYSIDAMNDAEIVDFVNRLSVDEIQRCVNEIKKIDKDYCISVNPELINRTIE